MLRRLHRTTSPLARRAAATTVATAATLLAGGLVSTPASATASPDPAPAPAFLAVGDLPEDPTWVAGPIEDGEPEIPELCVGDVLQPQGTRYRAYQTDLDVSAREHITTAASEPAAHRLQRRLDRAMRSCEARLEAEEPGREVTFERYGRGGVGDGVRVYGIFIEEDFGALSANVLTVGRDGTHVAVVRYGRIGREQDVPVRAVERTARTAVRLLG